MSKGLANVIDAIGKVVDGYGEAEKSKQALQVEMQKEQFKSQLETKMKEHMADYENPALAAMKTQMAGQGGASGGGGANILNENANVAKDVPRSAPLTPYINDYKNLMRPTMSSTSGKPVLSKPSERDVRDRLASIREEAAKPDSKIRWDAGHQKMLDSLNIKLGESQKPDATDPAKVAKMQEGIDAQVMNSKPGSTIYETAKDLATGKLTKKAYDHFVGGMGQQSRFMSMSMMQLAKKINPNFNEAILENTQEGMNTRIKALDRQAGLTQASAEKVDKMGDIVLGLSAKVNRTNVPWLTNISYGAALKLIQDPKTTPDIKNFLNAVVIFTTDWARTTTGQTGGAAVTDSASAHFKQFLEATDSPETVKGVVALAKQETQVVVQSYKTAKNDAFNDYQSTYGVGTAGSGEGNLQATLDRWGLKGK